MNTGKARKEIISRAEVDPALVSVNPASATALVAQLRPRLNKIYARMCWILRTRLVTLRFLFSRHLSSCPCWYKKTPFDFTVQLCHGASFVLLWPQNGCHICVIREPSDAKCIWSTQCGISIPFYDINVSRTVPIGNARKVMSNTQSWKPTTPGAHTPL